jgi:hypothetical protein
MDIETNCNSRFVFLNKNNMAAARNLYLLLGIMTLINEPLDLGLWSSVRR